MSQGNPEEKNSRTEPIARKLAIVKGSFSFSHLL